MIKCVGGCVEVDGSSIMLKAELLGIIVSMLKEGVISKKDLIHIYETALIPSEEIDQAVKKEKEYHSPFVNAMINELTKQIIKDMKKQAGEEQKQSDQNGTMDLFNTLFGDEFNK